MTYVVFSAKCWICELLSACTCMTAGWNPLMYGACMLALRSRLDPTARTPPKRAAFRSLLRICISTTALAGTLNGAPLRSLVCQVFADVADQL